MEYPKYFGDGNDTVIANDLDNIIDSGRGNDSITTGAGNDIFMARSKGDDQDVITDFDVSLNLEATNIEVANGGAGNDILVGGGNSNVFITGGDGNMMIFVIYNLLKNALYYKAKIEIRTEVKSDGNYLYFKDYGPGIETDKLELIFESFFTSGKKDGTGLGLPFCKRIITAFDGNIICRSEIGKWTEFEIRFSS